MPQPDAVPLVAWIFTAGALVTLLAATYRKVRPWWKEMGRDVRAGRDALIGREAIVHPETGRELAPAVPGIGARMANVETAIVAIAQQQKDIAGLQATAANHDSRIGKLELAAVERVVGKAESTAAFHAIEAALKATPDAEAEAVDED